MRRSYALLLPLALVVLVALPACSPPELVTERYGDPSYYEVPRLLDDTLSGDEAHFTVLGDIQHGWRAEHKFYRHENWATWKHALFPFYQIYLFTNGLVGAVNYGRQAPDYGSATRRLMREAVFAELERRETDFILMLGDISAHDGRRAEHWGAFLDEYRELFTQYPLLPVAGNHEYANDSTYGLANWNAVFDYPRNYVQDLPHGALFVLNSNFIIDQHDFLDDDTQDRIFNEYVVSEPGSDEPSWLERELEKRSDVPFKIVATHHPFISFLWHSTNWLKTKHGRDLTEKRARFLQLLQRHNVQLILSGHEHVYEHSMLRYEPDDDPGVGPKLIHQVISSGGGVPIRNEATEEELIERAKIYEREGLDVKLVEQRATYHFTNVSIDADTMAVRTYEVLPGLPGEPDLLEEILIPRPPNPEVPQPELEEDPDAVPVEERVEGATDDTAAAGDER